MKPYDFHPEALDDAIEARDYLDLQQPGLGSDFDQEVTAAIERIRLTPMLYAIERGRVRRCILTRFSYSIFYMNLRDRIFIMAVAHNRRQLYYWLRRRPTS